MNVDVGEVIAQKYELVRLLGRGAMGEVWMANHRTLGQRVAIKFLAPEGEAESEATARRRFLFEAQVAARLSRRTRHVVSVIDHGEERGTAYLVMELLDGETLDALVRRAGGRPLREVVEIVAQMTRALSQAHAEAWFHRDLKPANIFLGRDEHDRPLVKLLDFGLAGSLRALADGSTRTTARGMVLGTPGYMSPEQVRGALKLDHRCDLWALGVVAYEALSGELPFLGATPQQIFANVCAGDCQPIRLRRRDLPEAIDTFFRRAFALDVALRFQTAGAFAEAFARAAEGSSAEPAPMSTTASHARVGSPRRPMGVALGVVLMVSLTAALGVTAAHRAAGGPAASAHAAVRDPGPEHALDPPSSAISPLSAVTAAFPLSPSVPSQAQPAVNHPVATREVSPQRARRPGLHEGPAQPPTPVSLPAETSIPSAAPAANPAPVPSAKGVARDEVF